MRRIQELIGEIRNRYPGDTFFQYWEESCREKAWKHRFYKTYNEALDNLDSISWDTIKIKASNHFLDHRVGNRKQGFFNQLNESFAYSFIKNYGLKEVLILPENGKKTPDISYVNDNILCYCEVKTINISDKEIERRNSGSCFDGHIYNNCDNGFFNKLISDFNSALGQIHAQGQHGFVYVVIIFDDFTRDNYSKYIEDLRVFVRSSDISNLVIQLETVDSTIMAFDPFL